MGGEVGGGFRVGNSCTPVVDSCRCMAKPIQYCKVKRNKMSSKQKGNAELSREGRQGWRVDSTCL